MFIDELEIYVKAGKGGNGSTSFRREKYVEFGGPDGGDGGHGGSVVFTVDPAFNTLMPLRNVRHYRAEHGGNGRGSNMYGASGSDLELKVPPGTMIRDRESGNLLGDLTQVGDRVIVAQGGRGGKGNKHFASSTNRAPRFAQPGEDGEERWLKIELKIMADIGLVGFPNAGKSTLISRLSAAKPKVADYPFTTLKPSLGVVKVSIDESFVMADIPGIIEGAHEGAGLGLRFLRHIERTRLLLLLVDPSDPNRDAHDCYHILRNELDAFSKKLGRKPFAVAITKSDVEPDEARLEKMTELIAELDKNQIPHYHISSVTGDNIETIRFGLHDLLKAHPRQLDLEEEIDDADEEEETPAADDQTPIDPLDMV